MAKGNYNVILVPQVFEETIEQIIKDYSYMAIDCKSPKEYEDLFTMFFEEISVYVSQDLLLDDIEHKIGILKDIQEYTKRIE